MCLCVKQYNRIIDCGLEIPLAQLDKELKSIKSCIICNLTLNYRLIILNILSYITKIIHSMQPTFVVFYSNINQNKSTVINDIIANHHYVIHQDNGYLPQHIIICCAANDIIPSHFLLVYKVTLFLISFSQITMII